MEVNYRLLGMVGVEVNGVEVVLDAPMVRGLLAVLLLARGQFVGLKRLRDQLWEAAPRSAYANVRTYASTLRRRLAAADPAGARRVLGARGTGYRLLFEADELDLLRFSRLANLGRRSLVAGDFANAATVLRQALSLWRGTAGEGVPVGSPVELALADLNADHAAALADLTEARLGLGEGAALVGELRVRIRSNPLDERSWGQLIRALHLAGDPAGALVAYDAVRVALRDELGIEPSRELQELQRAVLRRD